MLEEIQVFLMAMVPFTTGKNITGGDVQGGEQGRGAMTDIVVGETPST